MSDFLEKVGVSDLNEEQQQLVDVIGFDNLKKLIHACGGTFIYIPKSDTLTKKVRNQQIKREFDGKNISQLATRYNLSVRSIRDIVMKK